MRAVLPISEPKCCSDGCGQRHKCARFQVEYVKGRPVEDFLSTTAILHWCRAYLPLDYATPRHAKKPHEAIKGIC